MKKKWDITRINCGTHTSYQNGPAEKTNYEIESCIISAVILNTGFMHINMLFFSTIFYRKKQKFSLSKQKLSVQSNYFLLDAKYSAIIMIEGKS